MVANTILKWILNVLIGLTKDALIKWESKFLTLLNYNTRIKPSIFAKYVTELRQVFVELVGVDAAITRRYARRSLVQILAG